MTSTSLSREIAMANAMGYAWAAEDFTGCRTHATPDNPAGSYAFATAYALSRDEYDAGRRGSHPSVAHAYATWQRTGPDAPSVHEPGTPPARPQNWSAAITFTDGGRRWEHGPADVIIAWAARYGVTLAVSEAGEWTVPERREDIAHIAIEN